MRVTIKPNTTIVDVAYNLTGSLAGIPVVLNQLPTGDRIGFEQMPFAYEDVPSDRLGQTWTPQLDGLTLDLTVEVYDAVAKDKAPYSTNLFDLQPAIDFGVDIISSGELDDLFDLL